MRTIIIEDEIHGMNALEAKIERTCSDVEIVGRFHDGHAGIEGIRSLRPDLVFCDVHLGPVNAFSLLGDVSGISYNLIITTGHREYGIEALRAGALEYLLKPIDEDELKAAVEKVRIRLALKNDQKITVAVPVGHTKKVICIDQIMYVLANNQRTIVKLAESKYSMLDCNRLLRQVEEKLTPYGFIRIHKSHMINPVHVDSYSSTDGGFVLMKDGQRLNIGNEYDFPFFLSL